MSEFIPLSSIEKDNDVSWYKSFAAGVASGILKVPEGIVSLAAELIDLGADTDTAASVEEFFDKLNPFEEVAEQRAIGKLTESLIQIGVPGGIGAKLANKAARNLTARALGAKRAGMYPNLKGKGIQMSLRKAQELNSKLKVPRYAAIALGGAAGEALVADTEETQEPDGALVADIDENSLTRITHLQSTAAAAHWRQQGPTNLAEVLQWDLCKLLMEGSWIGIGDILHFILK